MVIVVLLVKRGTEQGAMARLEALVDRYAVLLQRRGNSRGAAKTQIIHNVDYGVSLSGDGTAVGLQQKRFTSLWRNGALRMAGVKNSHVEC